MRVGLGNLKASVPWTLLATTAYDALKVRVSERNWLLVSIFKILSYDFIWKEIRLFWSLQVLQMPSSIQKLYKYNILIINTVRKSCTYEKQNQKLRNSAKIWIQKIPPPLNNRKEVGQERGVGGGRYQIVLTDTIPPPPSLFRLEIDYGQEKERERRGEVGGGVHGRLYSVMGVKCPNHWFTAT